MNIMEEGNSVLTPRVKRVKNSYISRIEKETILNTYEKELLSRPDIPISDIAKHVAVISGVGRASIFRIIQEYKKYGVLRSPKRTRSRKTFLQGIEDSVKANIKTKVVEFCRRTGIVTLDKVLEAVNDNPDLPNFRRSTFHSLLKELGIRIGRPSKYLTKSTVLNTSKKQKPGKTQSKKKQPEKKNPTRSKTGQASTEQAKTNPTQIWTSLLNLHPIGSEASTSGSSATATSNPEQHTKTATPEKSSKTVSGAAKPKAKRPRKILGSPSPSAPSQSSEVDPVKLCVIKMEIEDDGYNQYEESYIASLASSSSPKSQSNAPPDSGLPFIKTEIDEEIVPTLPNLAPVEPTLNGNGHSVELFFMNMAETVMQFPPHLIEETKTRVSSVIQEMVKLAVSEGCTNIVQKAP